MFVPAVFCQVAFQFTEMLLGNTNIHYLSLILQWLLLWLNCHK